MLRYLLCLWLGATAVCGQFVSNSSSGQNSSNVTGASSKNASNCLNLDDDERIQKSLISPKNYYSISRAIYPSIDIPSLYVRITVLFNSSSTNGSFTLGKSRRYTWSKSCLYVATEFVSLSAMSVYSLLTIFPQRRETELFITLPEFCNVTEDHLDERINTKMVYFLSTLEDIAVIPTAQDPRLNTAECVVEEHGSFDVKIFSGFRKVLMHVCWFILFISVIVGYVGSSMFIEQLKKIDPLPQKINQESLKLNEIQEENESEQASQNQEEKNRNKEMAERKCQTLALRFLLYVVAVPEGILLIVALPLAAVPDHGGVAYLYPVIYFFAVLLTQVAFFIYSSCKVTVNAEDWKTHLRNTLIHFTFQTSAHHLLWIILGIMTEPLWAIPVLVIICGVLFWIHLLAYYYMKTITDRPDCEKSVLISRAALLVLSLIFEFLVLVVVTQSLLGTDPVIGIVSSALTTFGSWWMSIIVKNSISG